MRHKKKDLLPTTKKTNLNGKCQTKFLFVKNFNLRSKIICVLATLFPQVQTECSVRNCLKDACHRLLVLINSGLIMYVFNLICLFPIFFRSIILSCSAIQAERGSELSKESNDLLTSLGATEKDTLENCGRLHVQLAVHFNGKIFSVLISFS
jgi:hypothetical protein